MRRAPGASSRRWMGAPVLAGVLAACLVGCGEYDPPQIVYTVPDGFRGVLAIVEDENGEVIAVDSVDVAEVSFLESQIVRARNLALFEREHFPKLVYRDGSRTRVMPDDDVALRPVSVALAKGKVTLFTVGTAAEHTALSMVAEMMIGPDGTLVVGAVLPRLDHDGEQESAAAEVRVIAEFRELFPGSVEFVSYPTGQLGEETWNSIAEVGGRGILTMRVPLIVDRGTRSVTGAHEPEFSLQEVDSVVLRADGTPEGVTFLQNQMRFSRDLWAKLYDAKGDLSAIGFRFEAEGERDGLTEFVDTLGPRGG